MSTYIDCGTDDKCNLSKRCRDCHDIFSRDENHPSWKGNNVTYRMIHMWLVAKFGKANTCENVDCSGKSETFEWALVKGCSYERQRENFIRLCKSCHTSYDMTDEARKNMSLAHLGKKLSMETRMKMSLAHKRRHRKIHG